MTKNFANVSESGCITVVQADYHHPQHAAALVELLDAYACDPAGGAQALSAFAKNHLVAALAARPQAFSVLAFATQPDAQDPLRPGADPLPTALPVGLVNCFEGFSTFACQPLVNLHDVVVLAGYRGRRVAERMLALVESLALARGACKLTLEVLQGNQGALRLYQRVGFVNYQLDPAFGTAQFLQKSLTRINPPNRSLYEPDSVASRTSP